MPKGQANPKQEEKNLAKYKRKRDQNIFKMSPIDIVYYKETVSVNFESKRETYSYDYDQENGNSKSYIDTAEKEKFEELSITPKFNFDSKYYTSSFIIPYEGEESDEEMQKFHKNKTTESQKQIDFANILIPKPKSKNQYCAVCRFHYDDYLNHISDYDHKKNIKKSKFNNDIEYLAILLKERMKNNEKDGVMTRSAKRRLETTGKDYFELDIKANKKRKNQTAFSIKSTKSAQDKEDVCAEGQTPFNKKWHFETTAKSIYSALD